MDRAGEFREAAWRAMEQAGFEVETARLATVPFPELLGSAGLSQVVEMAQNLESAGKAQGYNYISMGPALPSDLNSYAVIPDILAATRDVFLSGMMASPQVGVSLPAVRACGQVIQRASTLSPDGFANLRFAALANVAPGSPFFPAAYHQGDSTAFAIATEAADLAVEAFTQAPSLEAARARLIDAMEKNALAIDRAADRLAVRYGVKFGGIDFSLAPYPAEAQSLGTALERLGVPAVGRPGSLAAAAILVDTMDQARFPRTGFSGLMLPVLEDSTFALRAAEGILTVKDLLLFSAVCGTGLDIVPLPGDTSAEALAALMLDLAALSQRLEKPLTARLMPIPGKSAGDPTNFDFSYFANSRVMALEAEPMGGVLAGEESFLLHRRKA